MNVLEGCQSCELNGRCPLLNKQTCSANDTADLATNTTDLATNSADLASDLASNLEAIKRELIAEAERIVKGE